MKQVNEMTIPGRIRSLRMALRKAGSTKVDEYDATYLRYTAEFYGTIEDAVVGVMKINESK